jgi:hypothetical protein
MSNTLEHNQETPNNKEESNTPESNDNTNINETIEQVWKDFTNDIKTSFPEFKEQLDISQALSYQEKFEYIKSIYPARFFDILYQNEEIFDIKDTNIDGEIVNTCFLPNLDFKKIWKLNPSSNTKDTIWKYLQLMLFSVVNNIDNADFGDTAKLFEAINEDEFKNKLEETMGQMQSMFENLDISENLANLGEAFNNDDNEEGTGDNKGGNFELPKPDELHSHLSKMLDGKIGHLAKEIADETAKDLDIDMDDAKSVNDVFSKMFKNPGKLMDLVKNVGTKLDTKMKSGEIKQSELMEEASDLLKQMKSMPGMNNIQGMLNKMGAGGLGNMIPKGAKMNMGAMQSQLNQNMVSARRKERMLKKLEAKQKNKEIQKQSHLVEEDGKVIYRTGEQVEKSTRSSNNNNNSFARTVQKKKKKGKK